MNINLTNQQIYEVAVELKELLNNSDNYFPARLNFFLLKNYYEFVNAIKALEETRDTIVEHYGIIKDNEIVFENNQKEKANNELDALLLVEQTLNLYPIKLSWLEDLKFTAKQMQALLPMIEED